MNGICEDRNEKIHLIRCSWFERKISPSTTSAAGDWLLAPREQVTACAAALLDSFPAAPVITLPGYMRGRPIGSAYLLGMLKAMADRDAPGGFHLGTEYTYCLHDPVTALATTRFEDPGIPNLTDTKTADYWRRRCTIAPGVWPTHMIETGVPETPHVDKVYALHLATMLPSGAVAARPGPALASSDFFDIEVKGTGGHGAYPHLSVDPITAASHILIGIPESASPEAIQAAKKRATDIYRQLKQGADFGQTAVSYSQGSDALKGGSLGWKKAGELPELFLNALKNLSPGSISEVLRGPNGFHILKLNDERGDTQAASVTQTHVRHILLRPSEILSAAEARHQLLNLRERIQNGEDFAALARGHSEDPTSAANGGASGCVHPAHMGPALVNGM